MAPTEWRHAEERRAELAGPLALDSGRQSRDRVGAAGDGIYGAEALLAESVFAEAAHQKLLSATRFQVLEATQR